MHGDRPVSDREAKPHAARGTVARVVNAKKRLKDPGQQFFRNSWPRIANGNTYQLAGAFRRDIHRGSSRSVPDRVPHHVLHRAAQQFTVSTKSQIDLAVYSDGAAARVGVYPAIVDDAAQQLAQQIGT